MNEYEKNIKEFSLKISKEYNFIFSVSKFKVKKDYLNLEEIFEKIYFEDYSYNDLKCYVIPALREIKTINDFLDILILSIKQYCEVIFWKILKIKKKKKECLK